MQQEEKAKRLYVKILVYVIIVGSVGKQLGY